MKKSMYFFIFLIIIQNTCSMHRFAAVNGTRGTNRTTKKFNTIKKVPLKQFFSKSKNYYSLPPRQTLLSASNPYKNKQNEDPSTRMLVFSDFSSISQVINELWNKNSTMSKLHAEKALRHVLARCQNNTATQVFTCYKNMPMAYVLLELYKAELMLKTTNNIELFALTSDLLLRKQNCAWYPFLLHIDKKRKLCGVFENALNEKALTLDDSSPFFFYSFEDHLLVNDILSLKKVAENVRKKKAEALLKIAHTYAKGRYEIISFCVYPTPYNPQTENKNVRAVTYFHNGYKYVYPNVYFFSPDDANNWNNVHTKFFNPQEYIDMQVFINTDKEISKIGTILVENVHETKKLYESEFKNKIEAILR